MKNTKHNKTSPSTEIIKQILNQKQKNKLSASGQHVAHPLLRRHCWNYQGKKPNSAWGLQSSHLEKKGVCQVLERGTDRKIAQLLEFG